MNTKTVVPLFSASLVNGRFDLASAVTRVLNSNSFVLGKEVSQFELEFARYAGVEHCVSVANGSDALELALRAVGVTNGSRVACVANAGFYSCTAIHLLGAVPVYVDVDEYSLNMCERALSAVLATRPAAVIVTHLYGQMAAIEPIAEQCRVAGIPLIEDCAQAHGALHEGRRAGSFADISCFSFYPTKNLGALGDGGAVLSSNHGLITEVKALRQYGWSRKYEVTRICGRNSRLDEIQAAVLREKLPALDQQNEQRRAIAVRYNQAFAALPLRLPVSVSEDFVAHLYVVRTDRREQLRAHLLECGVATDVHYPIADTMQPVFAGRRAAEVLPVTLDACATVMSLPCFPGMTSDDVEQVVQSVHSFF